MSKKLPVVFTGHGSPMNAIEDNAYTRSLTALGKSLPKPDAVLVVSAHWLTKGTTFAHNAQKPRQIYDFYGFPEELYRVKYNPPGSPAHAEETAALVPGTQLETGWGLDHGAWAVLKHMYPGQNIPAFQLSIDYGKPMDYHFELGRQLAPLRERGVLILGSGNIVHNLRLYFNSAPGAAFDWAVEFDQTVKQKILDGDHKGLVDYTKLGEAAMLSVPTPDHYIPMLYTLGAANASERADFFHEGVESSMSMRCFTLGDY